MADDPDNQSLDDRKAKQEVRFALLYGCYLSVECFVFFLYFLFSFSVLLHQSNAFYHKAQKHPILHKQPYHPHIFPSLQLFVAVNALGIASTILTTILHCTPLRRTLPFIIFLITSRLLLTGLSAAAILTAIAFLPRPLGSCDNYQLWPPGSNPRGRKENIDTIWKVIPPVKEKAGYVIKMPCEEFVEVWRYQVGVLFILILATLFATVHIYFYRTRWVSGPEGQGDVGGGSGRIGFWAWMKYGPAAPRQQRMRHRAQQGSVSWLLPVQTRDRDERSQEDVDGEMEMLPAYSPPSGDLGDSNEGMRWASSQGDSQRYHPV